MPSAKVKLFKEHDCPLYFKYAAECKKTVLQTVVKNSTQSDKFTLEQAQSLSTKQLHCRLMQYLIVAILQADARSTSWRLHTRHQLESRASALSTASRQPMRLCGRFACVNIDTRNTLID